MFIIGDDVIMCYFAITTSFEQPVLWWFFLDYRTIFVQVSNIDFPLNENVLISN